MKILILVHILVLIGGNQLIDGARLGRDETIKSVRRWVAQNRAEFDPTDVDELLNGPEWHVSRFYYYFDGQADLKEVLKLVGENLKWRKTIGLSKLRAEDFPCEFWLAGPVQLTRGREPGELVVCYDWRTLSFYTGGLRAAWYAASQFQLNQVDRLAGRNGTGSWKVMHDLSLAGLSNMADFKGIIDNFGHMMRNYAGLLEGNFVMPLPSLVDSMARLIINLTPEDTQKTIKLLEERERYFVVKKNDLPEFMGGRVTPAKGLMMTHFPGLMESCPPLRVVARQQGWSDESVRQFLSNTQHLIDYNAKQLNFRKPLSRF